MGNIDTEEWALYLLATKAPTKCAKVSHYGRVWEWALWF